MIGGRWTSAFAIGACTSGLWITLMIATAAAEEPRVASPETIDATAVQWQPIALRLSGSRPHPWWSFPVAIRFEHDSTGEILHVEGCWDGDRKWQVGFAPPRPGVWTWSSSSEDPGLDGHTGRIQVRRPTEEEIQANPNYRGHLRISETGRYFESADGTPRFLLADTLWAGNTARCGLGRDGQGPFYQYLEDRQAKGFNTVLMSLLHGFGDLPNHPSGDRNEGGHAFQQGDLHRLNALYFQALDQRMQAIWDRGFVGAHPIMWWGKTRNCVFDLAWAVRVTAYCAARYAAYPGLWSLSGEYQYAFADCGWTPQAFHELGAAVQRHNPLQRPLSIHPSARLDWDLPHNCQSSRPYHDAEWLDHNWLQTGQGRERMFNIVARARENRALTPARPVFCSEACYDVSDDPDQAYQARWQAWVALLNGSPATATVRTGCGSSMIRRIRREKPASRTKRGSLVRSTAVRWFQRDPPRGCLCQPVSLVATGAASRLADGRWSSLPATRSRRLNTAPCRGDSRPAVCRLHPARQYVAHVEAGPLAPRILSHGVVESAHGRIGAVGQRTAGHRRMDDPTSTVTGHRRLGAGPQRVDQAGALLQRAHVHIRSNGLYRNARGHRLTKRQPFVGL